MKFAKQIETEATELPQDWRPYLIQYRSLKKSLHYVVEELEARGLSSQLLNSTTPDQLEVTRFIYDLNGKNFQLKNPNSINFSIYGNIY